MKKCLFVLTTCIILGSCAMDDTNMSVSDSPSADDIPEPAQPLDSGGQQEVEESPVPDEPPCEEQPPVYRIPELIINELGTESVIVSGTTRAEFIEFKIKTDGNLGGLRVFILANSASPVQTVYDFPTVEVKKDEFVVLHLRTSDPSSIDELGTNLAESGGHNSSPTARDLWLSGTDKRLYKTAIVYIADLNGAIIDVVIMSDNPLASWQSAQFIETASLINTQSAWSGLPFNSSSATSTRTINRYAVTQSAINSSANWYITPTSGATPGAPNR